MNHSFQPSIGSNKCSKCHLAEVSHTDKAECDACSYVGQCEIYHSRIMAKDMLLCPSCKSKEDESTNIFFHENQRIKEIKAIDYSVKVKDDIFNAETVSIIEVKEVIEKDESIPSEKKHYALAEFLKHRHLEFSKLIFDEQNKINEDRNRQRAIQSYLNVLSGKLRNEEREKLQLEHIDYKPSEKPISKPKSITTIKFDKVELVKYANELGLPMSTIQTICVKKNMTPIQAAEHLKKIMSQVNPTN